MADVFAFEVSVVGTDWTQIVNARTRGQAKRQYHLDVIDAWPDVPFTAMRCRKRLQTAPRSGWEYFRRFLTLPGFGE